MAKASTAKKLNSQQLHELNFSNIIQTKTFHFKSPDDGKLLAQDISLMCPLPKRVELGLNELFINAIEHGNLDIHYDGGSDLYGEEVRYHKILKLLNDPQHSAKSVEVILQKNPTFVSITVIDQGNGFDYEKFNKTTIHNNKCLHGRGIYLAKNFCFDKLEYFGRGNIAKCHIYL